MQGSWCKQWRVFLSFNTLPFFQNLKGISTSTFSLSSKLAQINAVVILPCFYFNSNKTSRISIKWMVVPWKTGAYSVKKSMPSICSSLLAQNRALNFLISPSGTHFSLNAQVDWKTNISLVWSTTFHAFMASKISTSVMAAFQHLSAKGHCMASHQVGLSSLLAVVFAFRRSR